MRLQRLEINGFKSFSDRAELAFDHGVTAIVGPNGCGKSNVADALTWVLGEQSAKSLRGDRMEDVIFSGSDARKPGATAEVRVRLIGLPAAPREGDAGPAVAYQGESGHGNGNGYIGNANGNGNGHGVADAGFEVSPAPLTRDVEVTRRLYRSGESEYLIDGEVCRLRDIHELLMDTGLGAKAYAIIEQGKIGMILSSRPADRRQLIEEAAGITRYKSRRRAAELKLEAAQQNLTRVDDIVFEIEKQRGSLKRQAARARRYKRLREELRRWEKVLFAGRCRELSRAIDAARGRLADAREREIGAAGRLAEVEADLARLRIEQAEADARAAGIREEVHGRELALNRQEQQQDFDRHQADALEARTGEISGELTDLEGRRDPAFRAIAERAAAVSEAERARDAASSALAEAHEAHARAQRQIEGLDADVEAARSGVFAALNAATALRHAMEHAAAQRDRVGGTLAKLDVEDAELVRQRESVGAAQVSARAALDAAQAGLEQVKGDIVAREAELASIRAEHEAHLQRLRASEHDLARSEARLGSLVELQASRAEFGDAARMLLVEANGRVDQQGAVADYLDVDPSYERAVEACFGDLLQHVVVARHEQAAAGLALVREHDAGRCGFVVIGSSANDRTNPEALPVQGIVPLASVLRMTGPHTAVLQQVVPVGYVAETFDHAVEASARTSAPIATLEGDLIRGPHLVSGGSGAGARGILATKREIKELRERIAADREQLGRIVEASGRLDAAVARIAEALGALRADQHRQEMVIVARSAEVTHAAGEAGRLARKADVVAFERRQAEEERASLDARHAEAQASVERLLDDQRDAEATLSEAQNRLMRARDVVDALSARAAEARAAHAAMNERASALAGDVRRLEEAAREMDDRIAARRAELEEARQRREAVLVEISEGARRLDEDVRALEVLRRELQGADEVAAQARARLDEQDAVIRRARNGLDAVRAECGELDVMRATAQSDMAHLAQTCADSTQCSLDQVVREVEAMESAGEASPGAAAVMLDDADSELEDSDEQPASRPAADGDGAGRAALDADAAAAQVEDGRSAMTAEDAIAALKAKIDRLGPVNMMAIEQFDDLEARHTFLTTQRADLIESMAQTAEAIKRIDETSKARFNEAFVAIQHNFQETFSTLFGGGRAGLALLDENDPIESGIDIVASPPGKRLQNVQLLSGGEKALTAIALMFAIFRYKPSPFCLLDEIDAPLDDANVGRFVEMLRGMLDRTQFILITHNRRTMEIANRLYGVTMEEPGVSKLIAVQLN